MLRETNSYKQNIYLYNSHQNKAEPYLYQKLNTVIMHIISFYHNIKKYIFFFPLVLFPSVPYHTPSLFFPFYSDHLDLYDRLQQATISIFYT